MNDLRLTREGVAMVIGLDRPETLNALRRRTLAGLREALEEAEHDDRVRVVVLTGTGRAFSSGVDLTEAEAHLTTAGAEEIAAWIGEFQDLTRQAAGHSKIIIAAVNGLAVGAGAELAIACDLRLAAGTAAFAFPEARRGLYPTNGVLYHLPRLVGQGLAADLLLTGRKLGAADALAAGLVSRVVEAEDLLPTTLAFAETIGSAARTPIALIKRHLRGSWDLDLEQVLALETEGLLECLRATDLLPRLTIGSDR
ncbi:hypothetical protein DP939_15930 [Spongiactinospora rosea]|uniref:Enoyl-CoA hydratase n=1 Tax=Spongiactinospora rosea TaxID=2248750 RepID=A0A366LZM2_9ACTN|nr:enoyl-CoA hydratase/isomerase family protein [Spongiactinospora rosea]RBQ19405.1 hypothetical protein DP939_15930 [Spongiactinospora rosea]